VKEVAGFPARCPACGQTGHLPARAAGHCVRCRKCHTTFAAELPLVVNYRPDNGPPPIRSRCPYCAEQVQPAAIKCKHCGEFIGPLPPDLQKADSDRRSDKILLPAVLLWLLGIGAHHFYVGAPFRGTACVVLAVLAYCVPDLRIFWFIVWVVDLVRIVSGKFCDHQGRPITRWS
jgi:TM2 domain-containing membrane protein YozV